MLQVTVHCPECPKKFTEQIAGSDSWTEEKDLEMRTKLHQHGYSKGHEADWTQICGLPVDCWSADGKTQYADMPNLLKPDPSTVGPGPPPTAPPRRAAAASSSVRMTPLDTQAGSSSLTTKELLEDILKGQLEIFLKLDAIGEQVNLLQLQMLGRQNVPAPPSPVRTPPIGSRPISGRGSASSRRRSRTPLLPWRNDTRGSKRH